MSLLKILVKTYLEQGKSFTSIVEEITNNTNEVNPKEILEVYTELTSNKSVHNTWEFPLPSVGQEYREDNNSDFGGYSEKDDEFGDFNSLGFWRANIINYENLRNPEIKYMDIESLKDLIIYRSKLMKVAYGYFNKKYYELLKYDVIQGTYRASDSFKRDLEFVNANRGRFSDDLVYSNDFMRLDPIMKFTVPNLGEKRGLQSKEVLEEILEENYLTNYLYLFNHEDVRSYLSKMSPKDLRLCLIHKIFPKEMCDKLNISNDNIRTYSKSLPLIQTYELKRVKDHYEWGRNFMSTEEIQKSHELEEKALKRKSEQIQRLFF